MFCPLLESFGIAHKIEYSAQQLVLWYLPGLFLRCLTEPIKGMLQCMGYIKELGFCSMINIATVIPVSYYFFGVLGWNEAAYGVVLTIYYFNACLFCLYFYFYMIPVEYRDSSLPLKQNFFWYFLESLKTSFANYYL